MKTLTFLHFFLDDNIHIHHASKLVHLLKIGIGHELNIKEKLLERLHFQEFFIFGIVLEHPAQRIFLVVGQIMRFHLHLTLGLA